MLHQCENVISLIIPVTSITISSIESLPIYVWAMHSVLWVIYSSSSRQDWRSVLCYLLYACLIRVSCVILTFILSFATCVNLIWQCTMWIIGCLSRMLYSYCFDIIWCVLSCSSESIYKSKSYRKSKRIPAFGLLEIYWETSKKFEAEIDAVSV